MKNRSNRKNYVQSIIFIFLMTSGLNVFSQQTLIKVDGWNAYVHLPWDYDLNPTKTYPTILFFPGLGEVGTDPNKLIANGPGAYIKQGWNGNIKVGSDSVKFIVISMQPPSAWPGPGSVKPKVDILRKNYRIADLYLTGLSMGGNVSLGYSYTYPDELTGVVGVESVVPSEGAGTNYQQNIHNTYKVPAEAGQKYLLFEQANDWRRNDQVVDAMNYWQPGSANYQYTSFGGGGHCCWQYFYGGNGNQPSLFSVDGKEMNIYEWIARNPAMRGALPVTIESVTAQAEDNAVVINWSTATEINSNYFEVQRSSDGQNYKKIGLVYASGNSNVLKQYYFRDEMPLKGNNLYRLKMVDLDGSFAVSKTVAAQLKNAMGMVVKNSVLNRTDGRVIMDIQSASDNTASISISDVNGRIFYRKQQPLLQGSNLISDHIVLPAKGVYYLRISSGDEFVTKALFSE